MTPFPLTVDAPLIRRFANATGDHARIHLDLAYAQSMGLPTNFAHGLLGASWAAAQLMPHTDQGAMQVNFAQPVFCGDTLRLSHTETDCGPQFTLTNGQQQATHHGRVSATPLPPPTLRLEPTAFSPDAGRVYHAVDVFQDGPRGACSPHTYSADEVADFRQLCGDVEPHASHRSVPPMLVFCRSFADWLQAFTQVALPDASFPGHLQDEWHHLHPVCVGDTLQTWHAPLGLRPSRSRPDMALLTIALQVRNQHDELVQHGHVLLMMQAQGQATPP